jgi:hypothetical protein
MTRNQSFPGFLVKPGMTEEENEMQKICLSRESENPVKPINTNIFL